MNCPNCGRHMSNWSVGGGVGSDDYEPAWHCLECDLTIPDAEVDDPEPEPAAG
jgi:hypothetical protein